MEKIPLRSKDKYGIYWFDVSTASLVFEKVDKKKMEGIQCLGWATRIRSIFGKLYIIAIFIDSGSIYLQINKMKWDIAAPENSFIIKREYPCAHKHSRYHFASGETVANKSDASVKLFKLK